FEIEGEEDNDETYVPAELEPQYKNSDESTTESEDEEDNIPLSNFQKLHGKRGSFIQKGDPTENIMSSAEVLTPWGYFERYLSDNFFEMRAHYTSQYHLQTKRAELNITGREIKQFFGLHAIMGCMKYPRLHMYWNKKFKFPSVANVLPRSRFFLLRNNFHVVHNLSIDEEIKKNNKLWRVQPMVDLIRNRCKAIARKVKSSFSIDEQMIPFLGRCPARQYVKTKPRTVGLKNVVLTTSDGIILDFEIYQGPTSPFGMKKFGLEAQLS
ncbi:PiggyBac transposable element-derived protein 3, partial [Gonioctena quinquepunctata]